MNVKILKLLILLAGILFIRSSAFGQELNTELMQSTFLIEGKTAVKGQLTQGTVFILGRPVKGQPRQADYILVTAAHVLDAIVGDKAVLYLRTKNQDGTFSKVAYPLDIRNNNAPLWVHHPDKNIDVACMPVALPLETKIPLISTDVLATDKVLEEYEIHPGDELLCLGYPLGAQANNAGFPILRSGKIASYPITPSKTVKSFLYDFPIYPGNSGGPVYFTASGRIYGGVYHIDQQIHFIAGLVSQLGLATNHNNDSLQLAIVVPAEFIAETINLIPEDQ